MLALNRKEGSWVEITHKSGDKMRICVYDIREPFAKLGFQEDGTRNFEVLREEAIARGPKDDRRGIDTKNA